MFAHSEFPLTLPPLELDRYLERGWFRMGQSIFTTSFLNFSNTFYSATWLRIDLRKFLPAQSQLKLQKKNVVFRIEIKPAHIDPIKELLYARYRQSLPFEPSSSLHQLMFGSALHDIYNTLEVNLYDGEVLVACGLFDVGEKCAAGITSFYDPHYKKYSLGKFLIYLKIEYCRQKGLQYFYPGYFVSGYPLFDYKLTLSKNGMEFLELSSGNWLPIDNFEHASSPLQLMTKKLIDLQKMIIAVGVDAELLKYEYFDANILINSEQNMFFDFPLFISYQSSLENIFSIIIFDIHDQKYHLMLCSGLQISSSANGNGFFSSHLLKLESALFSTPVPDEMVTLLLAEMNARPEKSDRDLY
jgi:arginyl-tRNA--protein-N-Asp/Glu arginylyltransferase